MWQDVVFLCGSVFSIVVLTPTLRDHMSTVPYGTSVPSAAVGFVYGGTFLTMGMTYSGLGSMVTGVMWGLIARYRSPATAGSTGSPEADGSSTADAAVGQVTPTAD